MILKATLGDCTKCDRLSYCPLAPLAMTKQNQQKNYEQQLKNAGVDTTTAKAAAKVLTKRTRSKKDQAVVDKAHQQIQPK